MPARPILVIGVLASCGLTVSLTQTLVIPLLPRFPRLLDTSTATVAWLVTATLVAGAVGAPLLGRMGDMYGKRRVLLLALGLVAVGSALGALAPRGAAADRGPGTAGGRARGGPAGHQHHARRAAGRPGGRRDRADELVARESAARSAAADRAGGRARQLAVAVRRGGRARCGPGADGPLGARRVADADRRPVRPARRARPGAPRWSACCWPSPGAPSGAGPARRFSACCRGRGGVRRCGRRYQLRARDPLVDLRVSARPAVLLTNLSLGADRLLDVRRLPGDHPDPAGRPGRPATGSGSPCWPPGWSCCPSAAG